MCHVIMSAIASTHDRIVSQYIIKFMALRVDSKFQLIELLLL